MEKGELLTGEIIKPIMNLEMASALAERLYGITCLDIVEINSYDDKNYKVTEDLTMKNPLITNHWPHGYVLKIMNSKDSENLPLVEAQNETMIFLSNHHINCPKPIRNIFGHYFSIEKLPSGKNHVIRLLEFQAGEILVKVPHSEFLFYQMGEYVANMDRLLKKFYHSGYSNHSHIWMMDQIPSVEKFKHAIEDPNILKIIDEVLQAFNRDVIPKIPYLDKGVIHGDFNEHNIIVNLNDTEKKDDWRITAIIDFGDVSVSCYLFELAITMCYAMLISGDLKTGGFVLGGYSLVRIVPEKEIKLLKTCVAARLCQSLVYGAYNHKKDPKNEYLLASQKGAMNLLPLLWNEPDDDVIDLWKKVADDYLTRSSR